MFEICFVRNIHVPELKIESWYEKRAEGICGHGVSHNRCMCEIRGCVSKVFSALARVFSGRD